MKPVQPEELSALLDGELSPQRADEVRAQLRVDRALAKELALLTQLDAHWRALAKAAAFEAHVNLAPRSRIRRWPSFVAAAVALAGMRLAPKFMDSAVLGVTLNLLALAILLGGVVWLLARETSVSPARAP